jgi:hypothetical protein
MTNASPSGFLVVLRTPEYRSPRNPRYFGVDAVPASTSKIPEEAQALNDYVFGNFKDFETNLILTYSKAHELWMAFSKSSREFEIIFCCAGPDDVAMNSLTSVEWQALGYDVAGICGDYWSIVDDIPASDWAKPYVAALNESGLFRTRNEAAQYLREYRDHREADYDSQFDVVYVVRVIQRN